MPRLSLVQTNFTAGEISPRLHGRTDIDRYNNAAKTMQNCHPVIHGGAVRREGTFYSQAAKYSGTKKARLIEFIVSRSASYMLEFGDLYVRIFSPSGVYTGIELVSPYTEAMLADIDYVQGADTMFLFHASVAPYRLRSFSSVLWDLSAAPFTVQPFDEQGHYLAANLTLGATTGTVTATASAAVFLQSDVGRNLISSAGSGKVTAFTDTTHVTVSITTAFASTALASGAWYLDVSPQALAVPTAKDPIGTSITLTGAAQRSGTITLTAKTGAITVTATGAPFLATDVGKTLYADSGVATITGYTNPAQIAATTSTDFASTSYASGAWGISGSTFRSEDVGKYVRLNGGMVLITNYASDAAVTARIVTAMTSIVASPGLAWTLEAPVWSATNGYPRTGTLHEQRLWCAGSTKYPQTIWGSRTGLYLDFTKGVADSDACSFTIASDEINPISYLAAARILIIHTYGGEFSMQGGIDRPITPTVVQIKSQTSHGSKNVRPLTIGKESIFVQRAGRKVRAMGYTFQIDGYTCPDLAVLAEHITASGIVSMCYQQEPDQLVWLVLADGSLLTCTLDRDQQVTGWAKHYTDGAFEWVAAIPIGSSEQVWAVVRRIVNGVTVRYIEWFDTYFQPILPAAVDPNALPPITQPTVYGCTVDAAKLVDNVSGQTVFTGLGHLEGKTVDVVADGSAMAQQVVTGGQITLPRASYRTLIGLHFKTILTMLTPEAGTGSGTAQGNSIHIGEITIRLLNTLGAKVLDGEGREQDVPFRRFGTAVLDAPPPMYSGPVRIEMLGWERGRAEISVVQDQPLPMHVLAVVRKTTIND
jgi:hypothetical protein